MWKEILSSGSESSVYDDTILKNQISQKADASHKHTTSDITDIDTTNKTNGYVPQYDSSTEKLVLKPLPTGTGSGATSLDGLTDVDVTTISPVEGDSLVHESGIWKPKKITGSASNQANAEIPLFIETFANGKNLPIHAKIVKFAAAWNGYKYWMAYTPWPDDGNENPSIAVSNDLLYWETPNGLVNPISGRKPEWDNFDYYSDTDLIYNPDTGMLECWYRWTSTKDQIERIYRKTSSNGIIWGVEELLRESVGAGSIIKLISPSVIYENGMYRIWVGDGVYKYYTSPDGYNWQFVSNVTGLSGWHFKMERTDKGIEGLTGGGKTLTHAISQDGITFTNSKIIMNVGNRGNFDDEFIYLACMVKEGTTYYVFYTGRSKNLNVKGIGLSISTIPDDITSIKGLTAGSYLQMAKPLTTGTTSKRPTDKAPIGFQYFDTVLGKPIWKKSLTQWVDANGSVV